MNLKTAQSSAFQYVMGDHNIFIQLNESIIPIFENNKYIYACDIRKNIYM